MSVTGQRSPDRKKIMSFTLYAATMPSYLQILGSMTGLLGKAEEFCKERGLAPDHFVQARLADDMLPFAYQVRSTASHSLGAVEGLRAGVFEPDRSAPPATIGGLRDLIGETITKLEAIDAAEIESFIGKDMRFQFGSYVMEFVGENFLMSFSQPNFYFHATTAYDILRMNGVQVGKRDFNGAYRKKA